MKKILLIILSCCFIAPYTLAEVPQKNKKADTTEVAGEDGDLQAEQKEAEKWLKNHIGKCKKLLSELKKIKKPNACKRAESRIKKLGYKLTGKGAASTEAKRLNTPGMRIAIVKYRKTLEKLDEQVSKELERVEMLITDFEDLYESYSNICDTVGEIMHISSRLLLETSSSDDDEEDAAWEAH